MQYCGMSKYEFPSNKTCIFMLPLPPYTSKRFSSIVAVWPHLGGGNDPVTDSSIHSSETVQSNTTTLQFSSIK